MPAFCAFKNSPFVILDLTDSGNGSSSPLSTYLSSPARITISNFAKGRFHIGRRYLTTSAKGFTFPVSPWRIAKYLLLKFSWANLRNESAIIWNQTGDKMLIRNSLFTSFFITVEYGRATSTRRELLLYKFISSFYRIYSFGNKTKIQNYSAQVLTITSVVFSLPSLLYFLKQHTTVRQWNEYTPKSQSSYP